ncbi:ATP-binding protein [Arthrobacter sp. H5]|uniref:sensor histidine kinase n=1 Tax=Arthrobacter sp. H5 TaxID=1267973 RepID=UPI000480CAE1|nr:ATP-binding protein [Arthrobacter sp. H5]
MARTPSIRTRITLAAAVIAGVALVIGAVAFAALLRGALFAEVSASVEADLEVLEAQLDNGQDLPEWDDERFYQVVGSSGDVQLTSDSGPEDPLDVAESEQAQTIRIPGEGNFLVLADGVDDDSVLIVGHPLEDVDDALRTVGTLLAVSVPLLIVLITASTWIVVGRALAPVERMRREVDEVTAKNLDRRLAGEERPDEIGRLAHTMNRMLDRLEQSQHSQRRFISDASHELKSPLASLRQYAEVARAHPDRVSADDLSGAVLDEGGRLERLVQGMLVLARADEQLLRAGGSEVDLDDLVLAEARRLRQSSGLEVDASGVGAARILGDRGLLGQVVRNLVDNAVQHADQRVALSLGVMDGIALFAVDDDGVGIPGADRTRVFERFTRLDEARARNTGGSGLGLAIVGEIVRAHGGAVAITDSRLGGARLEVRLPAPSFEG